MVKHTRLMPPKGLLFHIIWGLDKNPLILKETFKFIENNFDLSGFEVNEILPNNYFTTVRLKNGNTGAAMSYYKLSSDEINKYKSDIYRHNSSIVELGDYLFHSQNRNNNVLSSIQTALLSAMSSSLLTHKNNKFKVVEYYNGSLFHGCKSVCIIGFGGYLDYMLRQDEVERVHISDLNFSGNFKQSLIESVEEYRRKFPNKFITYSDGSYNNKNIKEFELVIITGSAFCNGSMDELLKAIPLSTKVVIQGQSACIYPKVIFDKGVNLVVTTLKPYNIVEVAKEEGGNNMRSMMEGGLSWIYILAD